MRVRFFQTTKEIVEIPISSPNYPKEWRDIAGAPNVLYAVGDAALLRMRKFAIVGSRRTPTPALKLGAEIAKELSTEFVIVTGTADGGDFAAIEGALTDGGKVICVLAGGFSALPQNQLSILERVANSGLIISPYPSETEIRAFSYEYRNKLLSGLSEGVLVVGAAEKSGALITAKYAKQQGKPIFALPYFPGSVSGAGCNALLKSGGILAENAQDIAKSMGINLEERKKSVHLTSDEAKVYGVLRETMESHVSELAEKSGIPLFKIRGILSSLEVKGLATSLGGNRYAPA